MLRNILVCMIVRDLSRPSELFVYDKCKIKKILEHLNCSDCGLSLLAHVEYQHSLFMGKHTRNERLRNQSMYVYYTVIKNESSEAVLAMYCTLWYMYIL